MNEDLDLVLTVDDRRRAQNDKLTEAWVAGTGMLSDWSYARDRHALH